MKNTVLIAIIIVVIAAIAVYYAFFQVGPSPTGEQDCINAGGTVKTSLCCLSTGDFPNLCSVGPCGCSPTNSHEVKICDCGEGKCWDSEGRECVTLPVG